MESEHLYRVIDHVCQVCGGRLLHRYTDYDCTAQVIRCADCGLSVTVDGGDSVAHEKLCSCGYMLPTGFRNVFRCARNPNKSLGMPEEITTVVVEQEARDYLAPSSGRGRG